MSILLVVKSSEILNRVMLVVERFQAFNAYVRLEVKQCFPTLLDI